MNLPAKIFSLLERLYNSLKYDGIYIVVSILLPLALWKIAAGQEIVKFLATGKDTHNVVLILFVFTMLTFSVWSIPTLAISLWKKVTGTAINENEAFKHLVEVYNGVNAKNKSYPTRFPIRYFAALPWIIFLFACCYSFYSKTAFALCITAILIPVLLYKSLLQGITQKLMTAVLSRLAKVLRNSALYVLVMLLLFLALEGLILYIICSGCISTEEGTKALIIVSNCVFLYLTYNYIVYIEAHPMAGISKYNHTVLLCLSVILFFLLLFCSRYDFPYEIAAISPIVVVVVIINLFILLADIFCTAQLILTKFYKEQLSALKYKTYTIAIYAFALIVMGSFFFRSVNSHRIRKVAVTTQQYQDEKNRLSLTAYFTQWYSRARSVNTGDTLTVFLVSGQGGGSRAGAWFYLNIKQLERIYGTAFSQNVFSISTISGSSSGACMYLADRFLYHKQSGLLPLINDSVLERTRKIYTKNYFSSAFWGLLIGDGIEGLAGSNRVFPKDRNYYLQKEELKAYEAANSRLKNSAGEYFETDFMYPYSDKSKNGDPFFPLFFINTAIVENGDRGIFSPVKLEGFSIARDIYKSFKDHVKCHEGTCFYNLLTTTCVNQSQSFPIINAYNYIECTGRFVDGGLFDNSGCTTTLEVYYALKKYCADSNLKVKFVCINILNSPIGDEYKAELKPTSIMNTPSAAMQSPFGGHQRFSYKELTRRVNANAGDTVIDITLQAEIVLTRMMGNPDIDSMYTQSSDTLRRVRLPLF